MAFSLTAIEIRWKKRAPPQPRLPLELIAVFLLGLCLAGLGGRGFSGHLCSIDRGNGDEANGDVSRGRLYNDDHVLDISTRIQRAFSYYI